MGISFWDAIMIYMARRNLDERNVRKMSKRGASYSITLPIELVRGLKWRDHQKLVVEQKGSTLIIKDWKK